eukprot:Skav203111  [mRNA]  locus=scaffold447:447319:458842:+ [translate_table: standard]
MVKDAAGHQNETVAGVGSWMVCSVAMMVLNKKAIGCFPHECTLTAVQMLFSVAVLLAGFHYVHIGSMRDLLRNGFLPALSSAAQVGLLEHALRNWAPVDLVGVQKLSREALPILGRAYQKIP